MKTNHVQRGRAYCYKLNKIVNVPSRHIQRVCLGQSCPYLAGAAQGEGIECLWDDGTDDPLTVDMPPEELQKRAMALRKKI